MNDEKLERYVKSLENRAKENMEEAHRFELDADREMMKFYRGIMIGRQRTVNELKQMLEEDE